jgi:hypothetical protein
MLRSAEEGDGPTGAAAGANSLEVSLHAAAQSLAREVRAALGRYRVVVGGVGVARCDRPGSALPAPARRMRGSIRIAGSARHLTTRARGGPHGESGRKHSGDPVQPPRMGLSGEAVYDAPGSYVQEK